MPTLCLRKPLLSLPPYCPCIIKDSPFLQTNPAATLEDLEKPGIDDEPTHIRLRLAIFQLFPLPAALRNIQFFSLHDLVSP